MAKNIEDSAAVYLQMFLYFAAFEKALKAARFLADKSKPVVDWDGFSGDVGDEFFRTVSSKQPVEWLVESPPKKFEAVRIGNGQRVLRPNPVAETIESTITLIEAVRTIRNNLLHGDKFAENPERDVRLTEAAVFVLQELKAHLRQHPRLSHIAHDVEQIEVSFPLALGP